MYFCDLSLPNPNQNLAWDEAIVEILDGYSQEIGQKTTPEPIEVLRLWNMKTPTVVLGRSSRVREEANVPACERDSVPILRRASGGAAVVTGPGCLMYSLVVDYKRRPSWRGIDLAHQQVMFRLSKVVQRLLAEFELPGEVKWLGTCDLTIDRKKFSGNALRCRQHTMIYHGTLLLNMPLDWIATYLLEPPRQPDYRQSRSHDHFVCNLMPPQFALANEFEDRLKTELACEWEANTAWTEFAMIEPLEAKIQELMERKYNNPNWHWER